MAILLVVDTIDAAEKIAEGLTKRGHQFLPFHAALPMKKRREIIEKLRSGQLDGIVATTIGDEGIDIPAINSIILLTGKALGRHRQRIGRASRRKLGRNMFEIHDICLIGSLAARHSALRFLRYLAWDWETKLIYKSEALLAAFMQILEEC